MAPVLAAVQQNATHGDCDLVDVPVPGVESDLFEESATPEYLFVTADGNATLDVPVRQT